MNLTGFVFKKQLAYDHTINLEVKLKLVDEVSTGKVKRQSLRVVGTVVGLYENNSIINFIIYEVEFPDIQDKNYYLNVIDEKIMYQVN